MLFTHKGKRVRTAVRASVEHLDPVNYTRLEAGDELVIYSAGLVHERTLHAFERVSNALTNRKLVCVRQLQESADDGLLRHMVWKIVPYEPRAAE